MYHGRHEEMMDRRAQIKQQTLQCRREKNQGVDLHLKLTQDLHLKLTHPLMPIMA